MTTTTGGASDNWNLDSSDLYLNPNETDLLINALNSNKSSMQNPATYNQEDLSNINSNPYLDFDTTSAFNWDLKAMSQGAEGFATYPTNSDRRSEGSEHGSEENSPDYEDGETGEKRKADSGDEEEEGSGKRQETGKKSQKPGRKPLTSEPTTKRKAQNRAAQRAFRERKEKHLKDLEDKVDELQKKSDSADSENAILKAQVDRLQTELTEYRKRLTAAPLQASSFAANPLSRNSWDTGNNNFNFEFPKFGVSSTSQKSRSGSSGQTFAQAMASPTSPQRSSTSQSILNKSDLKNLFSADVLDNAEKSSLRNQSRSNSASNRQLSPSNTASPASSGFNGFTSSCVTTPESTADLPEVRKTTETQTGKSSTRGSFCDDFQTACGSTDNPVPKAKSTSADIPALTPGGMTTTSTEASLDFGKFDWLANQNGGTFDPVLFGDYREPQDNIMNNDGWFFNDAFALPELGSPLSHTNSNTNSNTGSSAALPSTLPPKKTFMQEIEETQEGKEPEVVPSQAPQTFLTCHLLWDRVQKSPKVMSGEADMDDLCSQLKSKAKCSGTGAVIAQDDVDKILGPANSKEKEPHYFNMSR